MTALLAAQARGDDRALEWRGGALDYRGLAAWSAAAARELERLGVGPGDRVAALLPNTPLYAALLHAVDAAGAVLVPLNPRLTSAEIGWQIAHAAPAVVVVDESLCARLGDLPPGTAAVLAADLAPERMLAATRLAAVERGADGAADRSRAERGWSEPLAIVYTSGTTGRPKGAVLTRGNFLWSAAASAIRLGHAPGDRWLVSLPLCHVGGLAILVRSALVGAAAVLHEAFHAPEVARALREDDISHVSLVPTMLRRVLAEWGEQRPPASLRVVLVGGAGAPGDLVREARRRGFPVATTYGLTEATSQVTTSLPLRGDSDAPVGSGTALPGVAVRIVRRSGEAADPGEEGEVQVRGPNVMAGYWRDVDGTADACSGGWLRTGDLGRLDDRQELFVLARRDDLIVSGGENVYPAEVESALAGHPLVAEACVVGLADEEWGSTVAAAVVATDPLRAPAADDLRAFLRGSIAAYKVPRTIVVVPELPRTSSGKPLREAVRALLERPAGES